MRRIAAGRLPLATPAAAQVARFEVVAFGGRSFGEVVQYRRITGARRSRSTPPIRATP
jgi:hypothetical protein